ncbi:DUF4124 domain-containing protein [Duganella sp. CT11-25]|uniref:DUF4124 domain-containing protein n=1 Tax=Duganella sp. CT11-25 TaxID=3243027 RepID=UPI0039AF9EF5
MIAGSVMSMMKWPLACAALVLATGAAQAEIYRCRQANGALSYQDTPCASGEQRKVDGPATARHDPPPAPMAMPAMSAADEGKPPYPDGELRRLVRETVREEQGAPRPKKACPSEHDIRKIETDISSIRNRDNQWLQTELRKQLREAKACQ